jgi:hypothetical protein
MNTCLSRCQNEARTSSNASGEARISFVLPKLHSGVNCWHIPHQSGVKQYFQETLSVFKSRRETFWASNAMGSLWHNLFTFLSYVFITRCVLVAMRNCFFSVDDEDVSGAQADDKRIILFCRSAKTWYFACSHFHVIIRLLVSEILDSLKTNPRFKFYVRRIIMGFVVKWSETLECHAQRKRVAWKCFHVISL